MLKRIVFIRAGETNWNLSGRFQGWVASPLNDHGRLQVQRLANFVRHIGLTRLYSSDLKRAEQTAQILGDSLGFQPVMDERLREQNVGIWQGLTVPEMHGWYPDEYASLQADPDGYQIPGGESRLEVGKRVTAAIDKYISEAKSDGDSAVGIVSHTTSIRFMVGHLVSSDSVPNDVRFGNTSVTTLVSDADEGWKLVAVNDVMHLEGLESRYMPGDLRGG